MKNFIFWLLCLLTSISAEASHKVMFPHLCPRGQRIEKTLFPLSRIRQFPSTGILTDYYDNIFEECGYQKYSDYILRST